MLPEITQIILAFAVSSILYVTIDVLAGLPKAGGVCGAAAIGEAVKESGGDLHGGYINKSNPGKVTNHGVYFLNIS